MVTARLLASVLALAWATPGWAECADLLPTATDASGPRRGIEAADLIELRDIGMPDSSFDDLPSPLALSPDGKWIAFVLNRADLATNGYCRGLAVVPTDRSAPPRVIDRGGELMILTATVRGLFVRTGAPVAVIPQWSPDGQWVGYLKRIDGVTQLWRARADGSAAMPVTNSPVDVERWTWSGDGRDVLFASRPGIALANRALDEEAKRGFLYDARVRPDEGPRPQLREADVPQQAFAIDLANGKIRPATAAEERLLPPGPTESPDEATVRSREGREAGFERAASSPLAPKRIWATDRDGRRISCAAEACSDGIVNLWWADDGSLLFQRREGWAKGRMAIYRWSLGGVPPKRIVGSEHWLLGCLHRSGRLYCLSETATTPRRLVSVDSAQGQVETLFDPNPEFARLKIGSVERLTWRNAYGLPAWGDLVVPPGYVPGTRLPLVIVQYHSDGFLRGGTGDAHPIFLLAARGFAVLSLERAPMFGSNDPTLTTVDQIITAMTKDWGERRSLHSSLMAGIDKVVARGVADPNRIGITGLSDGVSTTGFALINSDRFAAASISTCCEDQRTVMTYGGIAWADWNRSVRNFPLATEDGDDFWRPMSLALNAGRIDTPILMQLADREYLIGLETFTALREQGKAVEMHVAPDEYHVRVHPLHRLAEYERDLDWFAFWLQGQEDPAPDKRAQYERWRAMRGIGEHRP